MHSHDCNECTAQNMRNIIWATLQFTSESRKLRWDDMHLISF